ncbi:hypothetical protein GZH46_00674, partial [Fragariocoptes setiger]
TQIASEILLCQAAHSRSTLRHQRSSNMLTTTINNHAAPKFMNHFPENDSHLNVKNQTGSANHMYRNGHQFINAQHSPGGMMSTDYGSRISTPFGPSSDLTIGRATSPSQDTLARPKIVRPLGLTPYASDIHVQPPMIQQKATSLAPIASFESQPLSNNQYLNQNLWAYNATSNYHASLHNQLQHQTFQYDPAGTSDTQENAPGELYYNRFGSQQYPGSIVAPLVPATLDRNATKSKVDMTMNSDTIVTSAWPTQDTTPSRVQSNNVGEQVTRNEYSYFDYANTEPSVQTANHDTYQRSPSVLSDKNSYENSLRPMNSEWNIDDKVKFINNSLNNGTVMTLESSDKRNLSAAQRINQINNGNSVSNNETSYQRPLAQAASILKDGNDDVTKNDQLPASTVTMPTQFSPSPSTTASSLISTTNAATISTTHTQAQSITIDTTTPTIDLDFSNNRNTSSSSNNNYLPSTNDMTFVNNSKDELEKSMSELNGSETMNSQNRSLMSYNNTRLDHDRGDKHSLTVSGTTNQDMRQATTAQDTNRNDVSLDTSGGRHADSINSHQISTDTERQSVRDYETKFHDPKSHVFDVSQASLAPEQSTVAVPVKNESLPESSSEIAPTNGAMPEAATASADHHDSDRASSFLLSVSSLNTPTFLDLSPIGSEPSNDSISSVSMTERMGGPPMVLSPENLGSVHEPNTVRDGEQMTTVSATNTLPTVTQTQSANQAAARLFVGSQPGNASIGGIGQRKPSLPPPVAHGNQASGFRSPLSAPASTLPPRPVVLPMHNVTGTSTQPLNQMPLQQQQQMQMAIAARLKPPMVQSNNDYTLATVGGTDMPLSTRNLSAVGQPDIAQQYYTPGMSAISPVQLSSSMIPTSLGGVLSQPQVQQIQYQQQVQQQNNMPVSPGTTLMLPRRNITRVEHISAECSNDLIRAVIVFNGTFKGIIYSYGYAADSACLFVNGTGKTRYEFNIRLNQCGTQGRQEMHQPKSPGEAR